MSTNRPAGPVFSVVIATFNRAHLVPRAIASVLDGELDDIELIVVDDGSTDDTVRCLEDIDDPRLQVITQQNRGRSAARNRGAASATGDYLTFLDSDDYAEPEWLRVLAAEFQAHPSAGIVFCGAMTRRFEGQVLRATAQVLPSPLGPLFDDRVGLFIAGAFAVSRLLFESVGGYDERVSQGENTELAHRLLAEVREQHMSTHSIDDLLIVYEQARTVMGRNAHRARLESARVMLEKHGPLYKQKAPAGRANYFAIAGTSAAALGELATARKFFRKAIRERPSDWRHYGRFLAAHVPAVANRAWPIAVDHHASRVLHHGN